MVEKVEFLDLKKYKRKNTKKSKYRKVIKKPSTFSTLPTQMKKLLDHHTIKKTTEVDLQNHITLDNKPSLEKGFQPFKKILITQDPKQEKARPLLYNHQGNRKFTIPKPRLTNGVVP